MSDQATDRLTRHQDEIAAAEKASGSVGFWLGVVVGIAAAYAFQLVALLIAGPLLEMYSRMKGWI